MKQIESIAWFRGRDQGTLAILSMFLLFRKFVKTDYIYKQNDSNEYFYIILDGEIEIIKEQNKDQSLPMLDQNLHSTQKKSASSKFMTKTKDIIEIPLLILGPGGYFGNEEGFLETKKEFSIKVRSDVCKVMMLPFDVFYTKLTLEN